MTVHWTVLSLVTAAVTIVTGEQGWKNHTVAFEAVSARMNHSDPSLLVPKHYNHELPPVPNSEELENWIGEQFDLLQVNYKEFLQNMDRELEDQRQSNPNSRRQVDRSPWLLDLVETVPRVSIYNKKDKCKVCRAVTGLLLHYVRNRASNEELKTIGNSFCVTVKAFTPRICKAKMEVFMDQIVFIMKRITLTPKEICGFILGESCGGFENPAYNWNITLPVGPKPPVQPLIPPGSPQPLFKVLHLSDIHYDPYYLEGTNADCKEPLCCRASNGPAWSAEQAAGRWGDYRACDTPRRTLENMLEHITKKHPDIDYVLWTGDNYPHNDMNVSKEDYSMVFRETAKMLRAAFPNIPIFPSVGNHDVLPPNCFPPPTYNKEANITWLYEELNKTWTQMLNYSEPTFQQGAFYSVLIRPGFRLISLNTVFGFRKNMWLLLNSTDPANMLSWFINELKLAEMKGEKVHVIGHISPGRCLKDWSENYNQIVDRYESTITAQFFGHTHQDEFELFYDIKDKKRPINVAYIAPSVTPFIHLNPGYRIYYVDGDHSTTTRSVIDHETWVLYLNKANLYNYPVWYKMYTTRSAYRMKSLTPKEWDSFVVRMAKEPDLFNLYYTHYIKNSTAHSKCNSDCKKKLLCDLRPGSEELCQEIEDIVGASSRVHQSSLLFVFSVATTLYILMSSRVHF